ncbi:hypothetical protein AY600_07395 [Phormidium willei BDU 130791]|nr:hypothetical protein AY600_07395 [Phormidium willei BDU 130791]
MARDFLRQTVSTSIAEVPMWVPTALIFAGLLLFLLQLAAQTLRHLGAAPGAAADPGQRE